MNNYNRDLDEASDNDDFSVHSSEHVIQNSSIDNSMYKKDTKRVKKPVKKKSPSR